MVHNSKSSEPITRSGRNDNFDNNGVLTHGDERKRALQLQGSYINGNPLRTCPTTPLTGMERLAKFFVAAQIFVQVSHTNKQTIRETEHYSKIRLVWVLLLYCYSTVCMQVIWVCGAADPMYGFLPE